MLEESVRIVLSHMLGAQVNWRLKGRFRIVSTDGGGWYASTHPARGGARIGSWKAIVREEGVRVALCRMLGAAGAGASIEVVPRGVGFGKDRRTADLREHVKETLAVFVEQAHCRSSEIIRKATEDVDKLSTRELELAGGRGGRDRESRAELQQVRKKLRDARHSLTVTRKGHPIWERRLANPGL